MLLVLRVRLDRDIFVEILLISELFVGTELGVVLKSSNSGGTVNEGTSSLFLLGMELGN